MGSSSKQNNAPVKSLLKLALVSMPWSLFNRPSIQLGTLKAYLQREADWLAVQDLYPYLETADLLGPEIYHWISQNSWVCEALYSGILFPEQNEAAKNMILNHVKKADSKIKNNFILANTKRLLEDQLDRLINTHDWQQYQLVGFSVCFNQLLASLAAARSLKKLYPQIKIVFGGSSCAGDVGRSLVNTFAEIDYIIEGEGEIPLLNLCEYLTDKRDDLPQSIFTKESLHASGHTVKIPGHTYQLTSLDKLPIPDFQEYFQMKHSLFQKTPFIPILPIEFSRGCWWNKCSFCNLNLQWCGYRFKNPDQIVNEVQSLSKKHGCLDFTFTDNMLPLKESVKFFKMMKDLQVDLDFFAEIRINIDKEGRRKVFDIYRQGGLSTIQVGIEALSSSLLKKLRKGVSAIENIAAMRKAVESGITLEGNLITQFPGSTQSEVEETLTNLDFVFPYLPLSIASFFLGHNSPVEKNPGKYGIKAVINHPNNAKLFPKQILNKMNMLVKDYRADRVHQRKIWKPVIRKVGHWQQHHRIRNESAIKRPLLSYRDGGDFLIIRQELESGTTLNHRLTGFSRKIYLYCTEINVKEDILKEFHMIPARKLLGFLDDLNKKRLMFIEDGKYLSLAVHINN
jgi:ribosomal peptide maturation radical SAM protein 1